MARAPKTPFTVHPALSLQSSTELDDVRAFALGPEGSVATVRRPVGTFGGSLDVRPSDTAPPVCSLAPPPNGWWECVAWSRDGARWAAGGQRSDGEFRGVVAVGARDARAADRTVETPRVAGIQLNQAGAAPMAALAPDGATVAVRVFDDNRLAMALVDAASGAVRVVRCVVDAGDLYTHAFGDDGALYTASAFAGDAAGVARYEPGAWSLSHHWRWPVGCAIVPAREGVWALGAGALAWRVAAGATVAAVTDARAERLARAQALRARATHKWDVSFLDALIGRIEQGSERVSYRHDENTLSHPEAPSPEAGAQGYAHEALWESSRATRLGDDGALISDGVSVTWLRERDGALVRTMLLDDPERCSPRAPRIDAVSAWGRSVGVLWRKNAQGSKMVLSRFELTPERA